MTIIRSSLLCIALIWSLVAVIPAKDSHKNYLLFVGTYTEKESKGIYAYRYDDVSGELASIGLVAETTNPSFLAVDPSRRYLYAVNEVSKYRDAASGGVSAFVIDRSSGKLSFLNEVASRGADPCYIAFDKTGRYALVANYGGGSVAAFPILNDGRVGEASAFVQHTGSSVNPERQKGPHAHWIETTADNRFAVAADLGLDQLLVYRFDAKKGSLSSNDPPFAKIDPGAGPRHVAFHPHGKYVYVVNELQSTVTSLLFDSQKGSLKPMTTVSTLPKGFSGENDTAEIHVHPTGKFLFASNRGHDSIAVFSVNPATGALTPIADVSTQGKTPRNFEIDPTGSRLFAANQESNTIVVFRIDPQTGSLTPTSQVLQVPAPVSLQFVLAD